MLEKYERPVKMVCLILAAVLAWELASAVLTGDPLRNLKIPPLPSLPGATNEPPKETNATTAATNAAAGTNLAHNTNAVEGPKVVRGTNSNHGPNMVNDPNVVSATNALHGTNIVTDTNLVRATNTHHGTNIVRGTNALHGANALHGSNIVPSTNPAAGASAEVSADGPKPGRARRNRPPGMMAMMGMGGMPGGEGAEQIPLPTNLQARVDSIIDSEIFGPVPRPMPMALLGIADQEAFIQATNGQSGPVKVGDEIGGIKLLRIGMNRVLVESHGEKQELTIFDGIGGTSLMPPPSETPPTNAPATNQANSPKQKENPQ